MNVEKKLLDELEAEFEDLKDVPMGTEEYKISVDGLTKLVDRAIEINKLNSEFDARHDEHEIEMEMKVKQFEEEKKDRKWKNGISVAGIVVPIVVTVWGTLKTLKFEETGTVTTNAGRSFMNRLFKK